MAAGHRWRCRGGGGRPATGFRLRGLPIGFSGGFNPTLRVGRGREGSGGVGRGRVGAWEGGRREEGTTDALVLALAGANRRRLALWR